jgi:predicted N-formylglutamate amidohydrolase
MLALRAIPTPGGDPPVSPRRRLALVLSSQDLPGIADVQIVHGDRAAPGAAPDLLIEVPHGATRTADFTTLAAQLGSSLPASLIDFFYVNTDAGAPELAAAVARRFVEEEPARTAAVVRCRIPRTFIDCNRRIDASPAELREGRVTPGLPPWITTAEDRALLRERYDAYVALVRGAIDQLAPGGAMLLLHTYAPRSVDVEVDLDIVGKLHRAWQPDVAPTWPLRPELDIIGRGVDGTSHAPAAVVAVLHEALAARGLSAADSATYPLHPSTLAFEHAGRLPGRALCLEVRRDLVADPFEPFAEMRISDALVARLAAPISSALRAWW